MTDKYMRNQSRFKPLTVDTPQMRAAVNLVIAVKRNETPDLASLKVIADAFLNVFGGVNPESIFGGSLGLVPELGRQRDRGFTPSDIVSAVIEIEWRKLGRSSGTLAQAKKIAHAKLVDLDQNESGKRMLDRDWKGCNQWIHSATDENLVDLVMPYRTQTNLD